jgi:hypothetical protein
VRERHDQYIYGPYTTREHALAEISSMVAEPETYGFDADARIDSGGGGDPFENVLVTCCSLLAPTSRGPVIDEARANGK